MAFLVMANGEYGEAAWYIRQANKFERVICADGGGRWARRFGIRPDRVVGDLDSLDQADQKALAAAGVELAVYPPEKDDTDTQLALKIAEREGAREVVIWGGTGSRLDHTLSNLGSAAALTRRGIRVHFESPSMAVYLVAGHLTIPGQLGNTVSLLVIGDRVTGVSLRGFRYPLTGATLQSTWQYAISNVITGLPAEIELVSGVLAVVHYRALTE
jgi:thiamine pyrophosphokinase